MTDTTNHASTLYDISNRGNDLWNELNAVNEALRELFPYDFFNPARRAVRNALDALSLAMNLTSDAAETLTTTKPVGELAAKVFEQTKADRDAFKF